METLIKQRTISTQSGFNGSLHPVLERVLLARDVTSPEAMDYSLKNLLPYSNLKTLMLPLD